MGSPAACVNGTRVWAGPSTIRENPNVTASKLEKSASNKLPARWDAV